MQTHFAGQTVFNKLDFGLTDSDIDDIQNELDESSDDDPDFFSNYMPRPKTSS